MKSTLNKIIFSFCIVISITSCHNFEHQKIVVQKINKSSNEELFDNKDESSKFNIKKVTDVKPNSFFPKPKVHSTVLEFIPKKKIHKIKDPRNLEKITKVFFSQRRKMIKKTYQYFI